MVALGVDEDFDENVSGLRAQAQDVFETEVTGVAFQIFHSQSVVIRPEKGLQIVQHNIKH